LTPQPTVLSLNPDVNVKVNVQDEAMSEPRETMTVGELAEQVGKTARAIRLYEELGLLAPRGRTCGNYRTYGPEALVRLRWIIRLHDLGLPLHEVKAFLDDVAAAESAGEAMSRVRARYARTLEAVDEQIQRLAGCHGCDSQISRLHAACNGCERHVGQCEPELVRGVLAQPLFPADAPSAGSKETP
jgi:DNA-binding transcriptional MerR regulator